MAETWVINESPNATFNTFSIDFTSNNEEYNELYFDLMFAQDGSIWYGTENEVYDGSNWTNQAYRTVTFAKPPTGDLLTWLQANAVQQVEPTPSTTNNIYFGNSTIDKIYFGTSEVSKIYYGNTLIYEVGGGSGN